MFIFFCAAMVTSLFCCFRMSAAVAMTVLTFEQVLQHCVLFSLSHAWQLGRVVMRARNTHTNIAQAIVEQQNGLVLIVGKVQATTCNMCMSKVEMEDQ